MAETFLILGASSFYGRNFANYVEARGDRAIRLSRPKWSLGMELPLEPFDYVVNFASKSLVAESWDDPEAWLMSNAVLTTSLIGMLLRRRFKRFIHVSTPECYGHTADWVDETYADWKPSTPYAVSRAAADMMLMAYHRAYSLPAVITRTANIYGLGQGSNRIIPIAFEAKRNGQVLYLDGGGITVRCFIHVRDACAATYLICKRGEPGQTYHISTDEPVTIAALVEMIGAKRGMRQDRRGKDRAYLLDSTKLRRMGWTYKTTLEEGLKEWAEKSTS